MARKPLLSVRVNLNGTLKKKKIQSTITKLKILQITAGHSSGCLHVMENNVMLIQNGATDEPAN